MARSQLTRLAGIGSAGTSIFRSWMTGFGPSSSELGFCVMSSSVLFHWSSSTMGVIVLAAASQVRNQSRGCWWPFTSRLDIRIVSQVKSAHHLRSHKEELH